MEREFTLEELTARHRLIDVVTAWVHDEWGKDEPQDYADTKRDLLDQPGCPSALVAIKDGKAIGLISYRKFPVPELNQTALWLNIIYVERTHRGQGVGSKLIRIAEEEASSYARMLFVYTPFPALYEKYAWKPFRPPNKKNCSVLSKSLGK